MFVYFNKCIFSLSNLCTFLYMIEKKLLQPTYLWIISILWWITYCETFSFDNLRHNDDEKKCMSELVSQKLLADNQFTASSFLEHKNNFQPSMARLLDIHSQSSPSDGKAWCPSTSVYKDLTEWIEVDFLRMTLVKGMYTMGRGDGNFKKFCPEIIIKYQRTANGPWITYHYNSNQTAIPLNTDARSKLRTKLHTIVVKKIRIYPLDSRSGPKSVCLKMAFLGCYFNDGVVNYSAPQGDHGMVRDKFINLEDKMYDGKKSEMVQHGIGILMDNYVHLDSNNIDFTDPKLNTRLMGWKCSEKRDVISIKFYFEQEYQFSEMLIYYVQKKEYNIKLSFPIIISIGYDNDTHRCIYNNTLLDIPEINGVDIPLRIPLRHQKGTLCTLNITCGEDNWVIFSEIEVKPVNVTDIINEDSKVTITKVNTLPNLDKHKTSHKPKDSSNEKDVSFLVAIGLAILLLMLLLSCMAFLFYKIKMLRKHTLNKKLELVAKSSNRSLCDPSSRTVFTIQSKHPSVSSFARTNYYTDNQPVVSQTYANSQPSDGVYASWPNTDEDTDIPNVDKEEEKCLLDTDINDNKSSGKEYAIYQVGVNHIGNEYLLNPRPSSTIISLSNGINSLNKSPLSVSHLKIVSSYELPRSTPIITYRNNTNMISYQHLINYEGICGDVDLRYQSSIKDHLGLDSNIKVVSTSSLVYVQPWVRGQYGSVDLATVALDNNVTNRYFIKTLSPDSPNTIKSKFILDLKILSTLNDPNLASLFAIVVDGVLHPYDIADVIRSAKFCLLIDHYGGYNLKEFLRNIYYPQQSQVFKSTTLSSQSQISSFMLLIITQICNGLKHLEELGLTHRDIGCRNCIIDANRQVKLYPGGYVTTQPFEDYCSIELQKHIINFPLRWLAPESISKGLFTSKSDVWSFGVTMWEVFTMCSLMPYPSLANEALLELLIDRENSPRLSCPLNCPKEMYDLMTQCWSWEEALRPTFTDMHMFLQIKNAGSTIPGQLILPAPPPLVEK